MTGSQVKTHLRDTASVIMGVPQGEIKIEEGGTQDEAV